MTIIYCEFLNILYYLLDRFHLLVEINFTNGLWWESSVRIRTFKSVGYKDLVVLEIWLSEMSCFVPVLHMISIH